MASSKNKGRNRGKRPTATIDLKAKDVSETADVSKKLGKSDKSQSADTSKADAGKSTTSTSASSPSGSGTAKEVSAKDVASKPAADSKTSAPSSAGSGSGQKATAKPGETPQKSTEAAAKAGEKQSADASKNSKDAGSKAAPSKSEKAQSGGRGGLVTHLIAGGLGGVLALLGFGQIAGPATNGPSTDVAAVSQALDARLTALEQKGATPVTAEIPAALEERIKGLEGLNARLTELTEKQTKLSGETTALSSKVKTLADPTGGGTAELRRRLDSMEGTIASLGKAAEGANGTAIPQIAALGARINDLRTELDAKITATGNATAGDVDKKLAALDAQLKARAADTSGTAEAIETLKGGTKRLSLAMETSKTEIGRVSKDIEGLRRSLGKFDERLTGLDKTASDLGSQLKQNAGKIANLPGTEAVSAAIAPVSTKLAAMEKQIGGVLEREAERADGAKKVLLSLELANLQRALDQGRPVASEIETIKKSAPEGMDLTALDKLAANVVPSTDELTREFATVASDAMQAEALDENASTFDKLFANARSIVRVRKTGDVEGTNTEAIIARAEDNLKRNDLRSAVAELAGLKDKAAAAMSDWIAKANDRLSVDAALAEIEAGLKSAVSSSATN